MSNSKYMFITLGGLRTSPDGQVLNIAGQTIRGLYAAGACAAHLASQGNVYASGLSLGPCSYFGRRAGQHVANHASEESLS